MATNSKKPKILVCIAFHYVASRLVYLRKVISSYLTFVDYDIDIIIDTNSHDTVSGVTDLELPEGKTIKTKTWNLDELNNDPFRLTWQHRKHISVKNDEYDYFIYTEDDILLPYANFLFWIENQPGLWENDLIPGFLRVEQHPDQTLVTTDNPDIIYDPCLAKINNQLFVLNLSPYAALWILGKTELKQFMADPQFTKGYPNYPIREQVAIGYGWKKLLTGDYQRRIAIALDDNLQIDQRAYVYHLPNNYANNTRLLSKDFGSVPVQNLLRITKGNIKTEQVISANQPALESFCLSNTNLSSEEISLWQKRSSDDQQIFLQLYRQTLHLLETEKNKDDELKKTNQELRTQLNSLCSSTSWKITKPLRLLARLARGDWSSIKESVAATISARTKKDNLESSRCTNNN